jgi:hypothetical protein
MSCCPHHVRCSAQARCGCGREMARRSSSTSSLPWAEYSASRRNPEPAVGSRSSHSPCCDAGFRKPEASQAIAPPACNRRLRRRCAGGTTSGSRLGFSVDFGRAAAARSSPSDEPLPRRSRSEPAWAARSFVRVRETDRTKRSPNGHSDYKASSLDHIPSTHQFSAPDSGA